MDGIEDLGTLEQDAALAEPLRRVAYEAGMMLGLEATRDEQAYHRRRLNRHRYWMHGFGTLAGMRVTLSSSPAEGPDDPTTVRLMVGPGIGIDGLGREVLIHETYCINLGEWLAAQTETHLREGYDDDADTLWLKVCVRQKDCAVAKQPVLARKLNLSTDAVEASRNAESIQLELIPELPESAAEEYKPWACHAAIADADRALADAPLALTAAEQATAAAVTGPEAAAQLALHARLLFALDRSGVSAGVLHDELEIGARLLLARVAITVTDVNAIVVNAGLVSINNLVRPFLTTPSQQAWLARHF